MSSRETSHRHVNLEDGDQRVPSPDVATKRNHNALRKRRPFDPQRRAEVANVRKLGACEDCRRKKTRCTHAVLQDDEDLVSNYDASLRNFRTSSLVSERSDVSSMVTSASKSSVSNVSIQTASHVSFPKDDNAVIISGDMLPYDMDRYHSKARRDLAMSETSEMLSHEYENINLKNKVIQDPIGLATDRQRLRDTQKSASVGPVLASALPQQAIISGKDSKYWHSSSHDEFNFPGSTPWAENQQPAMVNNGSQSSNSMSTLQRSHGSLMSQPTVDISQSYYGRAPSTTKYPGYSSISASVHNWQAMGTNNTSSTVRHSDSTNGGWYQNSSPHQDHEIKQGDFPKVFARPDAYHNPQQANFLLPNRPYQDMSHQIYPVPQAHLQKQLTSQGNSMTFSQQSTPLHPLSTRTDLQREQPFKDPILSGTGIRTGPVARLSSRAVIPNPPGRRDLTSTSFNLANSVPIAAGLSRSLISPDAERLRARQDSSRMHQPQLIPQESPERYDTTTSASFPAGRTNHPQSERHVVATQVFLPVGQRDNSCTICRTRGHQEHRCPYLHR